jgi:PAS domain S-box-containing protein
MTEHAGILEKVGINPKFIPLTFILYLILGSISLVLTTLFNNGIGIIFAILGGIFATLFLTRYYSKKTSSRILEQQNTDEYVENVSRNLELALRTGGIGIWKLDLKTKNLIWDNHIYKLYGISPDTYENARIARKKGIHPDDLDFVDQVLQKAMEEGSEFHCEYRVVWPDSSVHHIKQKGTIVYNKKGEAKKIVGTNLDITENKELESKLIEFKHFFNNNNDLACIANTEGYIEKVNAKFINSLGYTFNELTENPFVNFIHPEDLASTLKIYEEQTKGKEVINFVNRYRKKNGEYLWLDWNATTDEKAGKVYALARDITESRKIAQELQQTNAFLDTVIESIPNMLFVKDAKELKFLKFNKAGENLLGYQKSELIGKSDFDFFSPDQAQKFVEIDKGILKTGELMDIPEESIETTNGVRWLHTKKIPVNDTHGNPKYLIGISEDITDKIKQDKLLRQQAARLKSVNDELEAFSYSVSHDLRAPLRSLEGFSKALQANYSGKLDEDANRWLKFIEDNANRMSLLINNMLNFSKLTKKDVQKASINMKAMAQDVFDFEVQNYPKKAVKFNLGEIPDSIGDESMMRQVWQNLISNAFKYSANKDEIIIHVDGRMENDRNVYIVKDEGAGFNEKYKDKLFTAFQRLHSESEFSGTGIGLATVKRIITKHKGTIDAKSELEKGTEFIFTIPTN